MNSKLTFALLVLSLAFATSCKKTKSTVITAPANYMIIGRAGGFTAPTIKLSYYLIANGQLKLDTTVPYAAIPDDISKFHFDAVLPVSKYNSVKDLLSQIPSELSSKNGQHIGSIIPDMGYLDVRASVNGTVYRWYFEGDQSASSTAVQQFVTHTETVYN